MPPRRNYREEYLRTKRATQLPGAPDWYQSRFRNRDTALAFVRSQLGDDMPTMVRSYGLHEGTDSETDEPTWRTVVTYRVSSMVRELPPDEQTYVVLFKPAAEL